MREKLTLYSVRGKKGYTLSMHQNTEVKDEWTNCKALSFLYKCFKFIVLPLGNNFHNGLPGNMICNKILHVNHNYNIQCINVHLHVYNDYIFEFLSE